MYIASPRLGASEELSWQMPIMINVTFLQISCFQEQTKKVRLLSSLPRLVKLSLSVKPPCLLSWTLTGFLFAIIQLY